MRLTKHAAFLTVRKPSHSELIQKAVTFQNEKDIEENKFSSLGTVIKKHWWGGERCENMEFISKVQLLFNFISTLIK